MNIVKYVMYFIILTAVGILYERYNSKYNGLDETRQYDLIKKYLLNESSLATSKKPIIWIHTKYEVNARNWKSFYSRNSSDLNQPYIMLTLRSIITHCSEDFNICLIDDKSFSRLLPGWSVDIYSMADPIKTHFRGQALSKLLYNYGGMLVPNTFLCKQNLKPIFEQNRGKPFIFETIDRTITSYKSVGFANSNFMGCEKKNPVMKEMYEYIEQLCSTDFTSEKDFLGIINKWCYQKYIERQMSLLSGKLIGTIDIKDKPIIVDDLLSENFIDFDNNLFGIYIPGNEILGRSKYAWFARLSPKQVLENNSILGKHFLTCQESN